MASGRSSVFWSMYNGQLIIYPQVSSGAALEITGVLSPPKYTNSDMLKDLVKVPTDEDTEVQGLSPAQTKLLRYMVVKRLYEDKQQFDQAQYMSTQIRRIKHEMRATHSDDEFTDSDGHMRGDGNG